MFPKKISDLSNQVDRLEIFSKTLSFSDLSDQVFFMVRRKPPRPVRSFHINNLSDLSDQYVHSNYKTFQPLLNDRLLFKSGRKPLRPVQSMKYNNLSDLSDQIVYFSTMNGLKKISPTRPVI